MAIKGNRYYNDPAMAQAAANLSDLFGPPSGSDESGYAAARAKDLETNQRQAIWDYMQRPDADPELLDRAGVFSDLYDPTQSYKAVDTTAATARYGYDTQAATSRSNNIADNLQREAANKSDNLVKIITEGYGNIGVGETQPAIPAEVLAPFGGTQAIPEMHGTPKPQTWDEAKADYLNRLARGDTTGISDTDVIKQALLGTEVTPTVDAAGNPVLSNRFEAAGLKPVLSETEEKGLTFSQLPDRSKQESVVDIKGVDTYHAVDAKGGERSFVGYIGSDGRIYDQNDPSKPAEGVVSKGSGGNQFAVDFNPDGTVAGIRQGAGAAGGKPPTDFQTKAGFAEEMMEKPTKIILDAFDTGKTPTTGDIAAFQVINKMATADSFLMSGALPYMNSLLTNEGQTFFAAMQQALPYELMVRSGQAVTEGEYARKLIAMIPLPSDNPDTKAIKRNAFETSQNAIRRIAGAAAKGATAAPAASTAPATAQTPPAATPAPATASPAVAAPAAAAPAANAPAATAAPAEAMSPEDRAASIANAKAAIASGDYTKQEATDLLQQNGIVLKPGELD